MPATINPPWRLDPLQMPVNINWKTVEIAVLSNFSGVDPTISSPAAAFQVIDPNGHILWSNGPPGLSPAEKGNDFGLIYSCVTPTLRDSGGMEEQAVAVSGTADNAGTKPLVVCYTKTGEVKWRQNFAAFPAPDTSSNSTTVYIDCDAEGDIAFMLEIFTSSSDYFEYIGKLGGSDGSVRFAVDYADDHLVDLVNRLSATPGNIQGSSAIRCIPDGTIAGVFGSWWMQHGFSTSMVSILCYDGADGSFKGGSQNPASIGTLPPPGAPPSAPWYYTYTNNIRGFTALQNDTFAVLYDLRQAGQGPQPDPTWPGWPLPGPILTQTADEWYFIDIYGQDGSLSSRDTFFHGHQDGFWMPFGGDFSTPSQMPHPAYTADGYEGRAGGDFWARHTLPLTGGITNITPSIDLWMAGSSPISPTDSIAVPPTPPLVSGGATTPSQVSTISMAFGGPTITYGNTDLVVCFNVDGTTKWQDHFPYLGEMSGVVTTGLQMSPRPMKPL